MRKGLDDLAGPTTAHYITAWAGNLLLAAREEAGWTQRQLAQAAGVAQSTVARIESGVMQPTLPFLSGLLLAMGRQLRISVTDFDDHDRVLDRRAQADPDAATAREGAMDDFFTSVGAP